jgi:hypothetical protein
MVGKLEAACRAIGRDHPVPRISERKLLRLAREAAVAAAKEEQAREDAGLAQLDGVVVRGGAGASGAQVCECKAGVDTCASHEEARLGHVQSQGEGASVRCNNDSTDGAARLQGRGGESNTERLGRRELGVVADSGCVSLEFEQHPALKKSRMLDARKV